MIAPLDKFIDWSAIQRLTTPIGIKVQFMRRLPANEQCPQLDAPDFHWLRFDLRMALASSQPYQPFKIPAIGQSVTLSRPG